jgi:hypothetical protein
MTTIYEVSKHYNANPGEVLLDYISLSSSIMMNHVEKKDFNTGLYDEWLRDKTLNLLVQKYDRKTSI